MRSMYYLIGMSGVPQVRMCIPYKYNSLMTRRNTKGDFVKIYSAVKRPSSSLMKLHYELQEAKITQFISPDLVQYQ